MSTTNPVIAQSRFRWREWAFLILVCSLGIGYFVWRYREIRQITPPGPNASFAAVLAHIPTPQRIGRLERDGAIYVLVIGQVPHLFLPSGPPVYVFDRSERLIDWSSDIGDQTSFGERWGDPWKAAPINRAEAEAFFAEGK